MHRRGGKRIRMDDPPPEFDNPMTPATPMTEHGGQSVHDPEASVNYSTFTAQPTANSSEYGQPELEDNANESPDESPPTPQPTRRVTRSKGKVAGRLAESPPPPPLTRPRRGRGGRGGGGGGRRAEKAPPPSPPPFQPPPMLGVGEDTLYNILKNNRSLINQVVDMWIEQYKSNRESALVQLMQFFINSSGCKGKISPDMAQMEHSLIIKKMTQEFDEESGEYPLIMAGQQWKKFRANFCDFIQTLVKMCQYSIIYDQYLMDNIISLLTGLSDSQVRAFRHTATLAVMKLMTALVDVALLTGVNCDNCQRQYEAERAKTREKRANERLESLVARRQELEENMEEIKNMLSYMFKSVFVHRYRDTLPEIRAITMAEIGLWMYRFPANFLDDLYLKYIGWTLHDKVGEVRLKCLQALKPLYESENLKGKLELFTSKFKDRIVSMTLDKEHDVAVHAVRLVISILQMHHDVLTDKDCENVYELVYSSNRGVAQAAGEFLNVRLFRPVECDVKTRRNKKRLPNTPLIRDLVQFFIESELHEHGAYLVDSLIESNPMMKDWECMTDLLLEEPGPEEETFDYRQESSLIELMVCCVKQASTGEPPVGRGALRKGHVLSKEQLKIVQEDKQKMTSHFITVLPQLLEKFRSDEEKLINLVAIPQYFDLELYTSHRQEASLTSLLTKLREIINTHTAAELLKTCAKTLESLCATNDTVYTKCNLARNTIIDEAALRYKEAVDEFRNVIADNDQPNADELFNLTNSIKKVSMLYTCHNLNSAGLWDILVEDLPRCCGSEEVPAEALEYTIACCHYSILWSLHELEDRGSDMNQLKDRLHLFMSNLASALASDAHTSIKEMAYVTVCDMLIFFSEPLATVQHKDNPAMRELVYEPNNKLIDLLNNFLQERVFVQNNYDGQDERRIEELHKRRNLLAGFCKLIVYSIIPVRRASEIFKHYIKCYNDYGDIIKATISKAREIHKMNCALSMILAMQGLFSEMQQNNVAGVNKQSQEFLELKELSKRFSLLFGQDALKNREATVAMHKAGISFAFIDWSIGDLNPPQNILFLEILSELSNKLIRQDRRVIMNLLDSKGFQDEWAPAYKTSLGSDDAPQPPAKRNYSRRRQVDDEEEEENAGSDQDNFRIRRSIRLIRKKVLPRAFVPSPEPDIESFTSSASPSTSSCISSVTSSEALKLPAPHEETKTSDDGRTVITLPIRGANESLTSKSATTVGDQELNDEKAEGSEVSTRASSVNRDGEMSSSDSSVRSSVHGAASTIARRGSSDEGKESPSNKSTTTIGVEDLSEAEAEEYEEATSVNRDGEMSSPGSSVQTGVHITASTVALRGSSDEGEVSSAESSVSKSEPRKLPLVAPEAKRGPATTRRPSTANGTEASSPASSLESHVVVTHAEIHRSTTQPSRSSETSLDSEEGADKIEEAPIMSETTNASPPRKKCRPSTPKPRPRTPDTPQTSPSTRKSTSIKSDDRSESSLDSDIEANASPPSKKRIPPTLKPRPRTPDTPQTSPSTRKSTSIKSDARSETSLDSDIETDTINEAASVRERTNASPPNKKQRPRTPDTPQTSPSTRKSTSIKSDNSSETSLDSEVEADAINEATTVRERRNASPPKKKLRPSTPKPRPRTPDTPQTSPSTRKSTSIKSDDRSDTSLDSEIESDAVAEVATVREGTYAIPQQTRFRPPTPKPRPRTPDTPQTSPSVKKSTSIKSDGRSTPSLCSEIEAITTMADRTNKRPPKNRPRPPTPKPRPRARRTSSESISSPPKLKNNSG